MPIYKTTTNSPDPVFPWMGTVSTTYPLAEYSGITVIGGIIVIVIGLFLYYHHREKT